MITRLLLILLLIIPAPSWAAIIFDDTFTDTTGVDLDAHTPDTGTSWTERHITGSNQLGISSNALISETSDSGQGSVFSADATYSTANYTVTATFSDIGTGVSSVNAWIGCRYVNSGGADGYFASIAQAINTNDVRIYRFDNGTGTKISGSEDTAPATNDAFELECNGSAIGLKKNGSYVISPIADSTYSAAGVAMVGMGEILGITEFGVISGAIDITQFTVTTIDSAAAFGPLRRRL